MAVRRTRPGGNEPEKDTAGLRARQLKQTSLKAQGSGEKATFQEYGWEPQAQMVCSGQGISDKTSEAQPRGKSCECDMSPGHEHEWKDS